MTERWMPIPDWEGWYEVSDEGRVRSVPRTIVRLNRWGKHTPFRFSGKLLALRPDHEGRLRVSLKRPGRTHDRKVHQLVLEAFVGPRPDGLMCCHWDDDSTNNRLENLRWDTESANKFDSVRNGTHFEASKTHCKRGHEFTPENTYSQPSGRGCRACNRARYHERVRAAREGVNA